MKILILEPDPEKDNIFRTLVARNAVNYHSSFHDAVVIVPGREGDLRKVLRLAAGPRPAGAFPHRNPVSKKRIPSSKLVSFHRKRHLPFGGQTP